MPLPGVTAPRSWHSVGDSFFTDGFDSGSRRPGQPGSHLRAVPDPRKPRRLQALIGSMKSPGDVPYISQLDQGHWNDESNCGPTVMAMVGRAFGVIPDSETARSSIEAAGRLGHTRESGTSAYGLAYIADAMGVDFQQVYGTSAGRVRQFIEQGALVVVRGNAFAVPWNDKPGEFSGHVMLVVGVDDQGRFLVNDPYDRGKKTRAMTAAELERFGKAKDFRDKPFMMACADLVGPTCCREVLPGVPRF